MAIEAFSRGASRQASFRWRSPVKRQFFAYQAPFFVGPHGFGKTTLLETLDSILRERGRQTHLVRLNESRPKLTRNELAALAGDIEPGDILLVDAAEQMSRLAWMNFKRKSSHAEGIGLARWIRCAPDADPSHSSVSFQGSRY